MSVTRKEVVMLYVDRSQQQWVVRDVDGSFWIVPAEPDSWDHRQPFEPTGETNLEPVPGHYKYLLGLPC